MQHWLKHNVKASLELYAVTGKAIASTLLGWMLFELMDSASVLTPMCMIPAHVYVSHTLWQYYSISNILLYKLYFPKKYTQNFVLCPQLLWVRALLS